MILIGRLKTHPAMPFACLFETHEKAALQKMQGGFCHSQAALSQLLSIDTNAVVVKAACSGISVVI